MSWSKRKRGVPVHACTCCKKCGWRHCPLCTGCPGTKPLIEERRRASAMPANPPTGKELEEQKHVARVIETAIANRRDRETIYDAVLRALKQTLTRIRDEVRSEPANERRFSAEEFRLGVEDACKDARLEEAKWWLENDCRHYKCPGKTRIAILEQAIHPAVEDKRR